MTREEIKASVTMQEVLSQHNIEVKRGMCSCPFHGNDKHPSMKVYKDGFNCFACGANGDVFTFVQRFNNCDFKTAFLSLGGTYEEQDERTRKIAQMKIAREKEKREKIIQAKEDTLKMLLTLVDAVKQADIFPVYSADWCFLTKKKDYVYYLLEEYMEGKDVGINVSRTYKNIRQHFTL